jgi:hypothetical protein
MFRRDVMQNSGDSTGTSFNAFPSAADEAAMKHGEQAWDNEGGHMSSTAGRITHVTGAELPYVVVLSHHGSDATEHAFATMRAAEAFIKRNTPVSSPGLSALYDRPASEG